MKRTNIEIKAKCDDHSAVREILLSHSADFKGIDHQTDTYFNAAEGRLKLREGNIENYLIHYLRKNQEGPKISEVLLYKSDPHSMLKEILVKSLGVLAVVDKQREICFIDNVKFHLDNVRGLGTFVEIEAIGFDDSFSIDQLHSQCRFYMQLLNIKHADLITDSYSDMIIASLSACQ